MADDIGIHSDTAPHRAHGKGIMGALKDIPTWGWWAIGGAVLILILWKMRRGGSASTAPSGVDAGTTQLPQGTDPGLGAGTGGGSTSPDNTQALLDGFQKVEQQQMDALSQMMQGQSQAIASALDAVAQGQASAQQGNQDSSSQFSDMLGNILSAIQGLSGNPIASNPGTSGAGYPGTGYPTSPGAVPTPGNPPPPPSIYQPGAGLGYGSSASAADWASLGYVPDGHGGYVYGGSTVTTPTASPGTHSNPVTPVAAAPPGLHTPENLGGAGTGPFQINPGWNRGHGLY